MAPGSVCTEFERTASLAPRRKKRGLEGFFCSGTGVVVMENGARGDYLSLEIVPAVIREYL
jgi:hypothetical protein